jgi:hypothetical protein
VYTCVCVCVCVYRGAKKYIHNLRDIIYVLPSKFNWITVALCSRTFTSPRDRQDSHAWLVFLFCSHYILSITVLIQFFPFLKRVYIFWHHLCIHPRLIQCDGGVLVRPRVK